MRHPRQPPRGRGRGHLPTARPRAFVAMVLGCLMWGCSTLTMGCVSKVTMADVEGDDGESPHTVILYGGVRDTSRQYADYGVVDATILEDR